MKTERILVPLDGSPLAEAALTAALDFGRGEATTLMLLRAAEAHTLPGADPTDEQVTVVREAEEYLAAVRDRRARQGVSEAPAREGRACISAPRNWPRRERRGRRPPAADYRRDPRGARRLRRRPPGLPLRRGRIHEHDAGPPRPLGRARRHRGLSGTADGRKGPARTALVLAARRQPLRFGALPA